MGKIGMTIAYLRQKPSGFYWEPSRRLIKLGFHAEPLGTDEIRAIERARALNAGVTAELMNQGVTGTPAEGTISYVIALYKKSDTWLTLSPKTQRGYQQALDRIETWAGDRPARTVTRKAIKTWQRALEEKAPAMAAATLRVLRIVLGVAMDEGYRDDNPALKLGLHTAGGDSEPWSAEDIEAFCETAIRMGYRSMALAVRCGECLGQREGDTLRFARAQFDVKRNLFAITQSKTRTRRKPRKPGTRLEIPVLPELRSEIEASPIASPVLIVHEGTGRPYKEDHFRHLFAEIREKAGLPKDRKFMHLRHTCATRLGEAGCSDDLIRSVTGHKDRGVVSRYVKPNSTMSRAAIRLLVKNRKRTATENGKGR